LSIDEILWRENGINYLRPEIQLLHKAPGHRPKDQRDFETCLPVLDAAARTWLISALEIAHPEHPWIDKLRRTLESTTR